MEEQQFDEKQVSFHQFLYLTMHTSLLHSMWKQYHVWIHTIHKTLSEKYTGALYYFCRASESVLKMDTLLSHEAIEEYLWMAVKHCNEKMEDVVHPDFIQTIHIQTYFS